MRVTPRAGRSGVAGARDGTLLIRLAAPPLEGAANAALIELLASVTGRPKRDITIVAGQKSREKRVRIAGLRARDLHETLSAILPA